MPQYSYHLRWADDLVHDDEARGMPAEAIEDLASISARSIIAADIGDGVFDLRGQIEVEDDQGEPVTTLRFCDAVWSVGQWTSASRSTVLRTVPYHR